MTAKAVKNAMEKNRNFFMIQSFLLDKDSF